MKYTPIPAPRSKMRVKRLLKKSNSANYDTQMVHIMPSKTGRTFRPVSFAEMEMYGITRLRCTERYTYGFIDPRFLEALFNT